jgi:nucleotide-binding universal stress UspA family protein
MNVGKILVPLDGSVLAEAALWQAMAIAEGATLSLLRAAEAGPGPESDSPAQQVAALREAQRYLRTVVERLQQKGQSRVEANVWYGPPAAAIVEAARSQKADLIVMATHGRGGLGRLGLGTVAGAVLRGTRVPVLVVRPDAAPVDVASGAGPAGESFRV